MMAEGRGGKYCEVLRWGVEGGTSALLLKNGMEDNKVEIRVMRWGVGGVWK